MLTPDQQHYDVEAAGCLRGARCWLITSGKAGMVTQAKGIADQLGVEPMLKTVDPRAPWRFMAPWGPVSPAERFGRPGSLFAPPWPDIAIAVGRASIPYIRALRRRAGLSCYTVVLQDPRSGPDTADLIWVPAHDKRRGPNVITTLISPHGFTLEHLESLRRHPAPAIDALPDPRVAVILGGRNAVYRYDESDDARLAKSLESIARLGASFLITASRRTHDNLVAAVEQATANAPRIVWRGESDGPNPYVDILARADWFVVTADSVNMTGEACATGRPIYVFHPSGGSAKFTRYHQSLEALGATRPLPENVEALERWDYIPQVSAALIAHEIEQRYLKRSRLLPRTSQNNSA
ncbi:MAG: mitochondrial fission ELM1 family protein [Alphaproteobacteria bacterium]|nr:mitochondrial fission ELM1 family protein [Alphaproteobacteria bacterium]